MQGTVGVVGGNCDQEQGVAVLTSPRGTEQWRCLATQPLWGGAQRKRVRAPRLSTGAPFVFALGEMEVEGVWTP